MNAEAPIGILAADWAGLAVADAVQRSLPHEDVVYLADQAWAPYAGRPGAVVRDRVGRMAADLVEQHACKVVVLASLQATLDGLEAARARAGGVPVVGMEPGPALARAAALAGTGTVRAVVGHGCVRGAQLRNELKRGRDRSLPAGIAPLDADVAALLCAHACADPPLDRPYVSGADLAAASAAATVRGMGGVARRRRRGRRVMVSSAPATIAR
ncbi:MAG TPA: hypothetical protein VFI18_09775 [Gaiellales bacterium]|nr:hypothetical protein [Gaiellales bacterium]